MPSQPDIATDQRESLRCELEVPLRWCSLTHCLDAVALARQLGLEEWYTRQQALAELDEFMQRELDQIQDAHAAAAVRLLEAAVRRLAAPAETINALGVLTTVNLSIDGVSFAVPSQPEVVEPRGWLGLALVLPDGSPLLACLEVVWIGETDQMLHIGGRFHHVMEGCAKKIARTLLLQSPRSTASYH